jgi:hypothetical protein
MAENDEPEEREAAQGDGQEGPREQWDRREDESPRAFAAFKAWLEAEKRSLTDVARSSKFQCSVANVSRWARVHNWQARAWAYDVRREQEEREQAARDRAAMRKRHLKLAMMMQGIAAHGLAELQGRIEQRLSLNMSAEECKSLMAEGVKLERATLGVEKDKQFTKIEVVVSGYEDEADYDRAISGNEAEPPLDEGGKKLN